MQIEKFSKLSSKTKAVLVQLYQPQLCKEMSAFSELTGLLHCLQQPTTGFCSDHMNPLHTLTPSFLNIYFKLSACLALVTKVVSEQLYAFPISCMYTASEPTLITW